MKQYIKLLQEKIPKVYQESKCLTFGFKNKTFSLIINRGNFDLYIEKDKLGKFSSSKLLNRFVNISDVIKYIETNDINEKSFPIPNENDIWLKGKILSTMSM